MKHPVRTYEPKPQKIEALKFHATEAGVNAAKRFCGASFTTQVIGARNHTLRFLVRAANGSWFQVLDGNYIYRRGPADFHTISKEEFEINWKPVKNDE